MSITTTADKVLNACHRLNAEAYEKQALAHKGKRLRQFTPCAKAEELMAVIRKGEHFGTCHMRAAYTICPCHSELTEHQLMDYEYDETYKLANYAHDYRTLYPKFCAKN
jgi:hypothetical protein